MPSLYETYRPKDFTEVVGQDRVLTRLLCLAEHGGLDGEVIALMGPSGTGKTSIARLIAQAVAEEINIEEIDAQKLLIDTVDQWERRCAFVPMGNKPCHAFIINEMHMLNSHIVSRLQTTLELQQVQKNSTWLFTTTNQGQQRLFGKFDALPFLSRAHCFELSMDQQTVLAFAQRARAIAQAENLDGKPLNAYVDLVTECKGNLRQALQKIASGEMLID